MRARPRAVTVELYTECEASVAFGGAQLVRLDLPPHAADVQWHTDAEPPVESARRMCSRVRMYANVELDPGGTLRGAHAPPLLRYVLVKIGAQWHGYDHADVYAKRDDERALARLVPKTVVGAARTAAIKALGATAVRVHTLRGQLNAACVAAPLDEVHAAFYAHYIEPGVDAPEDALVYERLMHVAAKDDAKGPSAPSGPEHGARVKEIANKATFGWLGEVKRFVSTCVSIAICVFLRFLSIACEKNQFSETSWTLLVLQEMVRCAISAAGAAATAQALLKAGNALGKYVSGLLMRYTPYAVFVHSKGGVATAAKCVIKAGVPFVVGSLFPALWFLPPPFNVSLVPMVQRAVDELIGAEYMASWCNLLDTVRLVARELGITGWSVSGNFDIVTQITDFVESAGKFVTQPVEQLESMITETSNLERAYTIVRNVASAAGIAVPWPDGASGVLASWAVIGCVSALIAYKTKKSANETFLSVMFDRWARFGASHFAPSVVGVILACNLAHPVEAGKKAAAAAAAADDARMKALGIDEKEHEAMEKFFGDKWNSLKDRGPRGLYADYAICTILGVRKYDPGVLESPEAKELRSALGAAVAAGRPEGDKRALLALTSNPRFIEFVARNEGKVGTDVLQGFFRDKESTGMIKEGADRVSYLLSEISKAHRGPWDPAYVKQNTAEAAKLLGVPADTIERLRQVAETLRSDTGNRGARGGAANLTAVERRILAGLGASATDPEEVPTPKSGAGRHSGKGGEAGSGGGVDFSKLARDDLTLIEIEETQRGLDRAMLGGKVSVDDAAVLERRLLLLRIKAGGDAELEDRIGAFVSRNAGSDTPRESAKKELQNAAKNLSAMSEADAVAAMKAELGGTKNQAKADMIRMYAAIGALGPKSRWSKDGTLGMMAAAIVARHTDDATKKGDPVAVKFQKIFVDADDKPDADVLVYNDGTLEGVRGGVEGLIKRDKLLEEAFLVETNTDVKMEIARERDTLGKLIRYRMGSDVPIDQERLDAVIEGRAEGPTTKPVSSEGVDEWEERLKEQRGSSGSLPKGFKISTLKTQGGMLVYEDGIDAPRPSDLPGGRGFKMNLDNNVVSFNVDGPARDILTDAQEASIKKIQTMRTETRRLIERDKELKAQISELETQLKGGDSDEIRGLKGQRRNIAQWVRYSVGQQDVPTVGLESVFASQRAAGDAEQSGDNARETGQGSGAENAPEGDKRDAQPEKRSEPEGRSETATGDAHPRGASDPIELPPRDEKTRETISALAKTLNEQIDELNKLANYSIESDNGQWNSALWAKFIKARESFIQAAAWDKAARIELERAIPATHGDILLRGSVKVESNGGATTVRPVEALLHSQLRDLAAANEALRNAALADRVHQVEIRLDEEARAPGKNAKDFAEMRRTLLDAIQESGAEVRAWREKRLEEIENLEDAAQDIADRLEAFHGALDDRKKRPNDDTRGEVLEKAAKLRALSGKLNDQRRVDKRPPQFELGREQAEAWKNWDFLKWSSKIAEKEADSKEAFHILGGWVDPRTPLAYEDKHDSVDLESLRRAPNEPHVPLAGDGREGMNPEPETSDNSNGTNSGGGARSDAAPEQAPPSLELKTSEAQKASLKERGVELNKIIEEAKGARLAGGPAVFARYLAAREKFLDAAGGPRAGKIRAELERLIPGDMHSLLFVGSARVDVGAETPKVTFAEPLLDADLKLIRQTDAAMKAAANLAPEARVRLERDHQNALTWLEAIAGGYVDRDPGALGNKEVKEKLELISQSGKTMRGAKSNPNPNPKTKPKPNRNPNPNPNPSPKMEEKGEDKGVPQTVTDAELRVPVEIRAEEVATPAGPAETPGVLPDLAAGLGAAGAAVSGAAAGAGAAVVAAASGAADAVVGALAPSEERIIKQDVSAPGVDKSARDAVLAVLKRLERPVDPEARVRILDEARKIAKKNNVALRDYWRGGVALAPWVDAKAAAETEARLRSAHVRASLEVGPRVLVIGTYKGLPTKRGAVAVHSHGAVASVGAKQDPGFWRALGGKIAGAYAPMVVGPLAAVVIADAVVDAGAALAPRMLEPAGVCVVPLEAHCSAAPPDAEMHALGAFAAGARAYVLSARDPKRKVKYPIYRESRIDRNARAAARDVFAARVKAASNWAKALDTVVDVLASKGA